MLTNDSCNIINNEAMIYDENYHQNHYNSNISNTEENNIKFTSFDYNKDVLLEFHTDNTNKSLLSSCYDIFIRLPNVLTIEIFSYFNLYENINLCIISKHFNKLLDHNYIWKQYYHTWFYHQLIDNLSNSNNQSYKYKSLFKFKLLNPSINDRIQVYWIGQFVLAHNGPYHGKAWWFATIISIDRIKNLYLVRYDGWFNNWDEWVDRSYIRWPTTKHLSSYLSNHQIKPNDSIELQIKGRLCTAYLECKVFDVLISDSTITYFIRDVIVGKDLLVDRSSIQLRHPNRIGL